MNRLAQTFINLKEKGKKAFIPFVVASDPNYQQSKEIVKTLAKCGADIIEIGIPFSDPIADGPTNQKAAERALLHKTSIFDVFKLIKELREEGITTPLVLFTYLNPVYNIGYKEFSIRAKQAGADGAIVLDLPPEESEEYLKAMHENDLGTVYLCSPTTSLERLKTINAISTGFVYYVSRVGVTGSKDTISNSLENEIVSIKEVIKKPLVIGFGVSKPEHASSFSKISDGVVVGSSIVKIIESNQNDPDKLILNLEKFVSSLRAAT